MIWRSLLVILLGTCAGADAAATEGDVVPERTLRRQLARQPGNADIRFQLARILGMQQRYEEARTEYSRLLKGSPKNVDFLFGLAQVELWRGQPVNALPLLQKARRLAPNYADVWRVEIQALLALGNAEYVRQAAELRKEALGRFPQADWHFSRLDEVERPEAAVATDVTPIPRSALGVKAPEVLPALSSEFSPKERKVWEAGFSSESLTQGLGNWRSRYVLGEWHRTERMLIYGGLRETERYRLNDREFHIGAWLPVQVGLDLQIEGGSASPHHLLPAHYSQFQLHFRPAERWSMAAGLRRAAYDSGGSRVINFSIDRYLGNERFGYSLYGGRPEGASYSPSHRFQWAHHYGNRDWFGISLTRGRETEYSSGGVFRTSQVRSASLSGQQGLTPGWALTWEVGKVHQGDFYSRRGIRLGLRSDF